jgi:hypothetical protein
MAKKLVFFLSIFFVLVIFNFVTVIHLAAKDHKDQETQKILAEIDRSDSSSTEFAAAAPLVMNNTTVETDYVKSDGRIANLKSFFRKYNSPLYDYADLIVNQADQYQFDYRLVPAIAMQESNLCRVIPEGSYNCWGWGIYGSTITKFNSYDDAIKTISKGLKDNYINQGLVTASAIMDKYTPSSNGSWAHGVNTFLQALQ